MYWKEFVGLYIERNLVLQSINSEKVPLWGSVQPAAGLHMVEAKRFAAETDKIEAEIERKF